MSRGATLDALDDVIEYLDAARHMIDVARGHACGAPPPISTRISGEISDLLDEVDSVTAGVIIAREEAGR